MVRGLGRRPAERRHASSRCRARSPPITASACTRSSAMRACTAASISAPATARRSSPSTDGRCRRAGWAGGYGNQVRLDHAGGLATSYSHMSRIAVAPGARVRQGQVIGYVGSTGLSTGPHLHFETYRNGATINPRSVRFVGRAQLSRRRPRRLPQPAAQPARHPGRRRAGAAGEPARQRRAPRPSSSSQRKPGSHALRA